MALICIYSVFAFGQSNDLEKANELYQSAHYADAARLYEQVMDNYSEKKRSNRASLNVMTKLARCYSMNNRHQEAEKLYSEIVEDDHARPETFLYFGETLMVNGNYVKAKQYFQKYLVLQPEDETAALLIKSCEEAPLIKPYFEKIGVKPFPYNSDADDNAPIYWKGNILFSSDRKYGVKLLKEKSGWTGRDFLDLYYSEAIGDGTFAPPVQFSSKLSVLNKNLGNASFSSDGSVIYFTRNDSEPNKREIYNLQIYSASATGDKWKDIEKLSFCSAGSNYMHPAISPDGNTLYFTSDKPGGEGGTDLWVTRRNANGWGRPENLGNTINTPLNEGFPFVGADGSLYFCSKGHPGFGGFDIFKTKQKPDLSWEEPINLGRPINSSFDDISIFVNADGFSGLFTSAREGGDDDIYFFSPDINADENIVDAANASQDIIDVQQQKKESSELVSGNMKHSEEGKSTEEFVEAPVQEHALVENTTELPKENEPKKNTNEREDAKVVPTQSQAQIVHPASKNDENAKTDNSGKVETGQIDKHRLTYDEEAVKSKDFTDETDENIEKAVLQSKETYTLAAREMITSPVTEEAPAFGLLKFDELRYRLNLNTLAIGDRFKLDGARYDVNVWQPTPQVARALDFLAEVMKEYPTFVIELGAHTESIGMDAYNLELSKNRAELAREYLLREGITPDRIVAKGYGESELLNHCANGVDCSLMEHLVNQRLEIKILKL